LISFKGQPDVPFTDAMPAAAVFPFDELARLPVVTCTCGRHAAGACPDDYRRELEPSDSTIAELQSVVVAMRHRGDDVADLEHDLELFVGQLLHVARLPDPQTPPRSAQLIRLSMALAAVAVRYREEIP
jgi:hypothetical protein